VNPINFDVQKYRVASLYRTSYTIHMRYSMFPQQFNTHLQGGTLSFWTHHMLVFFHSTAVKNLYFWLFVKCGHFKTCGLKRSR